ncbi:MAG: DUF465 domain-containing protein [Alphaproteobacteria bacterium]|jgi:hypothetical protein|nr:YdcH family protein [Thalassospira sp.]MCE2965429.1 DUF465 domain-containing protein [Alphaproteobacteria bacterium]
MHPLRLKSLQDKHATLENQLHQELRQVHPNELVIKQIKKLKLMLRDQISRMVVSKDTAAA